MISLGVSAGTGMGGFRGPIKSAYGSTDSNDLYKNSVTQAAEDYSSIMGGYKDLFKNATTNPAYTNLAGLATTGGYSSGDIADLRERALSPIRSIYASANRDVDRQRALQGGYSPNYAAVKAKMARELSDKIGSQVRDTNAGIAQNVAQNRLSLATPYLNATTEVPKGILDSMRGLYGTTPANPALYGQQSLQASELGLRQQQNDASNFSNMYSMFGRRL